MPYSDFAEPAQRLMTPEPHSTDILGQPFSNITVALDWLSLSHMINELVKQTTGQDVFGDAAMALSGDWESVWRSAGALRNLAAAFQDIGSNVTKGNLELDGDWDGNAADAAFVYFSDLGSALSEQYGPLMRLAEAYETAAEGTYRLQEGVSGILKDLMDSAAIAVIAASAGTAAIETGVGFVTGWAIAAYEAHRIIELTNDARKLIATASALVNGISGTIQSAAADVNVMVEQLPGAPYAHPGEAR
ncbi:hypothetical protein [Actinoplanes couchii]|uniref:WXG100 family type VII secretion target n=1 Tax=Actinoplanes couchii TaxID=403638 RepID=A0ABQ3X1P3_9ACTN|nr:hypothetical protein [Actinoplanes couchii]MDR6316842.1 hypothetical protein [Actinoplanes couchii]GID52449.1 hypothetical protein Aco03nite_008530 [Actinoplanes couchii]